MWAHTKATTSLIGYASSRANSDDGIGLYSGIVMIANTSVLGSPSAVLRNENMRDDLFLVSELERVDQIGELMGRVNVNRSSYVLLKNCS